MTALNTYVINLNTDGNYLQNINQFMDASWSVCLEDAKWACMGTFAETPIVNYQLSFGDQETTIFCFPLPFEANKQKFLFLFSVCSKQMKVAIFR